MRRIVTLIAASWLAGGCGLVLDNPEPDEARLVVSGEAGKPIRLITSTVFVAAVNEVGQTRVEVFTADTVITALPYERVYNIEEDRRFLVIAERLDADLDNVNVRVWLDDVKQFDEGGILIGGQPYRFVYTFGQPLTRDLVVLL